MFPLRWEKVIQMIASSISREKTRQMAAIILFSLRSYEFLQLRQVTKMA